MHYRFSSLMIAVFLLTSCSLPPAITRSQDLISRECSYFFKIAEQSVLLAGVQDTQAASIPGFSYLRVNRFLSSFRDEITTSQFKSWMFLLHELAIEGWTVEMANLPIREQLKLKKLNPFDFKPAKSSVDLVERCGKILINKDLNKPNIHEILREQVKVADEYQTWKRVLGVYPLTAPIFRAGIQGWHNETQETFGHELNALTIHGELIQFAPPENALKLSIEQVASIIQKSSQNPLAIPLPSNSDLQLLFETFAPVFEIDIRSSSDLIGAPYWKTPDQSAVDTSEPTVYLHSSHTRIEDLKLLQLNYTIWFPSRPMTSNLDILGGHLDGITWRVTLLPNGKPWIFDTIHNCGCYHLFFPTQSAGILDSKSVWQEPAFAPQSLTSVNFSERPVIRIASNTHYIQRLYYTPASAEKMDYYQWKNADHLRSLLTHESGHRSLFGQNGIVSGSERGERFLFWPMGIPDPGAMRQWGHHATAFVGRRHFDDARLFEKHFKIINQ